MTTPTTAPAITVIMSCCNSARWLDEAINSVLSQTYSNFEFIIIDDGSSDETVGIIQRYALRDSRIVIVVKPHTGLSDSLNCGIQKARGEWIARFDSDDVCEPTRFEKQIRLARAKPGLVYIGTGLTIIDQYGNPLRVHCYPSRHISLLKHLCTRQRFPPHSSALYLTKAVRAVGGYRIRIRCAQDIDLWLRLSEVGKLTCLNEPLVCIRKHANSISVKSKRRQMISEQIAIVSYYIRKKGGDPVTEDEASFNYFRDWITEQLYEEGVFVKEDYWIHLKDVFSDAPNLISGLFKIVGASLKHPYMLLQLIQQRVVGEKISYRLVLKFINRLSSCPVSVMSGSQCMIIGIDAFNIRAGGGVTHLVELLRAADPITHGFKRIIIWGGAALLAKIEDRDWLFKIHEPLLDCGLPCRAFWERFRLKKLARQAGCDVVFVPGSSDASGFKPIVTMNQNLLPFEWREMRRYGWSFATLKFILLRWTQSRSFRKAEGVIDLTQHAQDIVLGVTGAPHGQRKIVPHGINPRFFCPPRPQRCFDDAHPCRVLYVSIVDVYKHQWRVAEAIAQLRSEGFPVVLELVGPAWEGMRQLKNAMNRLDPGCVFLTYRGAVLYEKLHEYYAAADIGVFASSCESMSNILAESMAAGLPIACSYRASMPEVLGDAGVYFDPEDSNDIARALRTLLDSPALRSQLAKAAFERAQQYSWKRCANETFGFLAECHRSFLKQTS